MGNNKDTSDLKVAPPAFRVWLCGAFRVERRVGTTYEVVRTADWGGSSYPRLLLKSLLCCPGRQARREALIEMLWPETDPEQAAQYLNTATTKLRGVLRTAKGQPSLLLTENDSTVYRLEDQQTLWVDVDEALAHLKEAELLGRTSPAALPLLERAADYFNQGTVLQEDDGFWVTGRRATLDQIRYRCRRWLADAYAGQNMPGQAETLLRTLLEEDSTDEDVLCCLMSLLHQQGMTHQALHLYEYTCDAFTKEGLQPTEATKTLVAQLQEGRQFVWQVADSSFSLTPRVLLLGKDVGEPKGNSTARSKVNPVVKTPKSGVLRCGLLS